MQLIPPFNVPKTDEDWDANNDSLGSMLVHQVMVTQSVNEKKSVLCDGIYNYFTAKMRNVAALVCQQRKGPRVTAEH